MRYSEDKQITCNRARRLVDSYMLDDPRLSAGDRGLFEVHLQNWLTLGRLAETKEWFVTTPATVLLTDGQVTSAWEEKAPDLDEIIQRMTRTSKKPEKSRSFCINKSSNSFALFMKGGESYDDRVVGRLVGKESDMCPSVLVEERILERRS